MTWIKLVVHSTHPAILQLADATGKDPRIVVGAIVDWFHWVDHNFAGSTFITRAGFRAVTGWADDSLADAMLTPEVDWLEVTEKGFLRPTRPDTHFSTSAKQRTLAAKRMSDIRTKNRSRRSPKSDVADVQEGDAARGPRCEKRCASSATKSAPREEKEKEEDQDTLPPPRAGEGSRLATAEMTSDIPEWWDRCKAVLDGWSIATRGKPMIAHNNEPQSFLAALRGMAAGPPVGESPASARLAEVIAHLWERGAQWKSEKYVLGAIRNELSDWRHHGKPSTGGSNRASRSASADGRRAARRSDEFAEQIELPVA